MAGLIKSQILKHLSKFAKNLSSNSINVSTLRGEGELYNLELNEKVLTDLLELPNWMLISQASVNRVSLKIQWTKLKSTPIHMTLDEVCVRMETCSELRPHGVPTDLGAYRSGSKYGFVEKVIDGMTVSVNSVYVRFNSPSFTTSFHLSRITLCSKSPRWQIADLRVTRLKDLNQQHILIFKELSWHTLKIESRSTDSQMTPIRLITNQSCCRMTVKKKLSDCSVVGCRLVLFSEDILWVLTDSQILSAYRLVESLSGLIKKSTEEAQKTKAARKLESIPTYLNNPLQSYGTSPHIKINSEKEKSGLWNSGYLHTHPPVDQSSLHKFQMFKKFDVVETSYHFYSEKVILHFCDDPGPGRSSYPDLTKGGTLQMDVMKIKLDYYPYHLALGDRSHWIKYQENTPYQWTKTSLNYFKTNLNDFFSSTKSSHTPLGRASPHVTNAVQLNDKDSSSSIGSSADKSQPTKTFISNQFKRLMSSCFLLTCKDVVVYKVALSKRKCKQVEMLTSDKTRLCLPDGTSFVHMEFSTYYYPGGFSFPIPPPKIYTVVSPFKVDVDLMSCLWLNAFACHLKERTLKSVPTPPYIDVHMEVLMPRIILKPMLKADKQKGRPRSLQILTSRLIISNVRPPDPTDPGSNSSLFTCLEDAQKGPLFFASGFPSKPGDRQPIPSKFLHHAEGSDLILRPLESLPADEGYAPDTLWTQPRDIFFFHCDPVWLEYLEKNDDKPQNPLPFIDPFPVSLWIHIKELTIPPVRAGDSCGKRGIVAVTNSLDECCSSISTATMDSSYTTRDNNPEELNEASLYVLAHAPSPVRLQVTRLQFVFLMRILDAASEFSTFLTEDATRIQAKQDSFLLAAIFPRVSLSFVTSPFPVGTPLPTSPVVNGSTSSQNPASSLPRLKDLVIGTEVPEDVRSSPSDPSLFPSPNFSPTEENAGGEGGRLAKSQSDGCLATTVADSLPNCLECPETVNISRSGEDLNNSSAGANAASSRGRERKPSSSSSGRSSISTSMRRGLTSGLHTLKNTLESSVGGKLTAAGDDLSDTASIHSDLSNDSDTFVMLCLENDHEDGLAPDCAVFRTEFRHPRLDDVDVEAATEVVEDVVSSSEPSEASTATRAKQYVGAVTFLLGNGQFIIESEGHNSSIKFQSSSLAVNENLRITMEEFQTNFKKSYSDGTPVHGLKSCSMKVRLNTEGTLQVCNSLDNERTQDLPCYLLGRYTSSLPVQRNSNLEMSLTGLAMTICMSSLMEIMDLIEDEIDPLPMPMKIKVEKLDIELVDMRSKLQKNSQRFCIPGLLIDRDDSVNFTILPIPSKAEPANITAYSSTSSIGPPAPAPTITNPHEKCAIREEDLRKELERVKEQLASCQRENQNLMKALTILHEGSNVRK